MADPSSFWSIFGGVDPYGLSTSIVPGATTDLSKISFNRDPKAWEKMLVPAGTTSPKGQTPPLNPNTPGSGAVPTDDINKTYQAYYDFYKKMRPELQADRASEYQMQAELTRKQMSDLYPYMSAAASEATARNLGASKQVAAFKESAPSNIQNIMASKQGQAASAADAEYRRAMGIAAQQAAATDFARKFAGQTFQQG
jgi:hypothetical protein